MNASPRPTPPPPASLQAVAAHSPLLPVALWMGGALLAFCGIAISVRGLSARADVFEVNAIRTGGGLALVAAWMALSGRRPQPVGRGLLALHASRNGVHWLASLLWTASVKLLPLATVFSLEFTTPMWVALFAAAFLGSRVPLGTMAGLAVGLAGVALVIQPTAASFDRLTMLPLATAAFLAGATLLTQRLTARTGILDVLFWMMAMQFALNFAAVSALDSWPALLAKFADPSFCAAGAGMVLCGLASQLCLTQALRAGNAVMVVSLDFLRVPLVSALGFALYGETVGLNTAGGTVLIVAAVLMVTRWRGAPPVTQPAATPAAT